MPKTCLKKFLDERPELHQLDPIEIKCLHDQYQNGNIFHASDEDEYEEDIADTIDSQEIWDL